jgi:uncharacterized membrane protein (GlpM family)
MHQVVVLAIKALNGGLFVVAFALIGEVLDPKRFAGLFSAAPSVALANLSVTIVDKGPHDARQNAIGMMVGAVALIVFCLVARRSVERFEALIGSAMAGAAWLVVAVAGCVLVLR